MYAKDLIGVPAYRTKTRVSDFGWSDDTSFMDVDSTRAIILSIDDNGVATIKHSDSDNIFTYKNCGDDAWEPVDKEAYVKAQIEKLAAEIGKVVALEDKEPWRADNKSEPFFFVDRDGEVDSVMDSYPHWESKMYRFGNYFRTEEEAEAVAVKIRQIFKEARKV